MSFNVGSNAIDLESSFELPIKIIHTNSSIKPDSEGFKEHPTSFTTDSKAIASDNSSIDSEGVMNIEQSSISFLSIKEKNKEKEE